MKQFHIKKKELILPFKNLFLQEERISDPVYETHLLLNNMEHFAGLYCYFQRKSFSHYTTHNFPTYVRFSLQKTLCFYKITLSRLSRPMLLRTVLSDKSI